MDLGSAPATIKPSTTSMRPAGIFLSALIAIISLRDGNARAAGNAALCDNNRGECRSIADCPEIFAIYHLIYKTVKYCDEFNNIICCPQTIAPKITTDISRKFERECLRFSELRGKCPTTPFIVNGIKAEPREFPFMALIGLIDSASGVVSWKCGGTLISENFVLTAAHCLVTNEEKPIWQVRLGELDHASSSDDAQPQDFNASNYILHPGYYDNDDQHNDIALIELSGNATLNSYVMPACLPSSSGNEFQQLTAAGWGQIQDAGSASSHLLKVTLDRFNDDKCKMMLADNQINTRTQLCAGSFTSSSDTCQGDSGGPIFVQHIKLRCMRQVLGVTSFGGICGTKNVPSVYTRVHLYTDWIERIVWKW